MARDPAGDEEPAQIRAGDEQHERGDPRQQPHQREVVAPLDRRQPRRRLGQNAMDRVVGKGDVGQRRFERAHLRVGHLTRRMRRQSRQRVPGSAVRLGDTIPVSEMGHHQRQPHIVRRLADSDPLKPLGSDADDRDLTIGDANPSSHHARIVSELRVPERRAHDGDRIAIDDGIFLGQEESPKTRVETQRRPVISGYEGAVLLDAARADANMNHATRVVGNDGVERRRALAKDANRREAERGIAAGAVKLDANQPIGRRDGKRPQVQ